MTETEAPLVPDANGMLPNGLHQPTIEFMQAACIVTAKSQDDKVRNLMQQDVDPERILREGWGLALLYALIEKLTQCIGPQTREKDIEGLRAEYPKLFGYWQQTLNDKRAAMSRAEAAKLKDLEVN